VARHIQSDDLKREDDGAGQLKAPNKTAMRLKSAIQGAVQ